MITAGLTNSFKEQLLLGVHDFSADVMKIALYTSAAELGPATTEYSSANEVSSPGYSAGGQVLLNVTVNLSNGIAYVSFDNPTWYATTFAPRGALIYNSTPSANSNANTTLTNAAVAVLDFGSDKTASAGTFTIIFPTADASNAIIRIA